MAHDPRTLPPDLPVPPADGACNHLVGLRVPSVRLASTGDKTVDLADITAGWTVIYVYPKTGVPGVDPPEGWDDIPGARGCSPQSCSYRDDHTQFLGLGVDVYGLSTQSSGAQLEFSEREHIPFLLLSDPELEVGAALGLPTFPVGGDELYRRQTLIIHDGRIAHVRYPVFPPNEDAARTLDWLRTQRRHAEDGTPTSGSIDLDEQRDRSVVHESDRHVGAEPAGRDLST